MGGERRRAEEGKSRIVILIHWGEEIISEDVFVRLFHVGVPLCFFLFTL